MSDRCAGYERRAHNAPIDVLVNGTPYCEACNEARVEALRHLNDPAKQAPGMLGAPEDGPEVF
jgi:hypothetical protein